MIQSLPDIIAVYRVPCSQLIPNITEKYRAHVPVGVYPLPTEIALCGEASCEAEQEYDNGGYWEKTVLQFRTLEVISTTPPQAFIAKDAQGQAYIIGARERPFPIVEVTHTIDKDTNVYNVKVTFSARKSLVPCSI